MNPKIEKLAVEADIYSAVDINGYYDNEDKVKKFAELLVRECAMFVVTELEGKVGSLIADATANRLEEHFGVEE